MKKLFTLYVLLVLALAAHAQDSIVTIKFDCRQQSPTITLIDGDAALYPYANQTNQYRKIYYLFTDAPIIKISPSSKLTETFGMGMTFNPYDHRSEWIIDDTVSKGNYAIISQKKLDRHTVSFRWEERAHLLISAKGRNQPDKNNTLFLVVLPEPPEDTLIANIDKYISVDKEKGLVGGHIIIHRTGRIIIDSIYAEGKKAYTTFRKDHQNRDTPYYRKEAFAQVEIDCPWDPQSEQIDLTVFCTRFNADGTMTHHPIPLGVDLFEHQIPSGVDLFEKSSVQKHWWIVAIIALVLLVLAVVFLLLRPKNTSEDSALFKKLMKIRSENGGLRKENEKLRKIIIDRNNHIDALLLQFKAEHEKTRHDYESSLAKVKHKYDDALNELEKENEQLKHPKQAIIDEATFIEKCDILIKAISALRAELKDNPELNEKLRKLEQLVMIKKQTDL